MAGSCEQKRGWRILPFAHPLRSALAKAKDIPQLFLKKSCKKLGTFSDRFQTSQRTKGNRVSLGNPFPTDPKGQYKELFGQKNQKSPLGVSQ